MCSCNVMLWISRFKLPVTEQVPILVCPTALEKKKFCFKSVTEGKKERGDLGIILEERTGYTL